MKMCDLKRSKSEMEEGGSEYPMGTRIRVEHPEMKKMGMDDMPEAGSMHEIKARGKVVGSHESMGDDGEMRRSLELHITHMGIKPMDDDDGDKDRGVRKELESAMKATETKGPGAMKGKK